MPTTNGLAFAGGVVGGMLATTVIIALAYYVLLVIAGWKVFEKAGEKGWKSLIPIYNTYIFYKIVGMKKWFWAILIASFVISFVTTLMGQGTQIQDMNTATGVGVFSVILTTAMFILAFAVSVMYSLRTSRVFGHGYLFAFGLFFLSGIFLLVLGFGRSKYNKKLAKSWGV